MISSRSSFLSALALAILLGAGCTKELREHHALSGAKSDFEAERYDQAEADCRKALLLSPDDPAAIRQLGLIYFAEGRMIQAYALLKKPAAAEPKNADLQLKLGLAAIAIGRRTDAHAAAKKAIDLQLTSEDAILLYAETSATPGEIDESRQLIQKLQQSGKDLAAYRIGLGVLRLLQKDQAGAETEFKRAIELDSQSSAANYEWGNFAAVRGEAKAAEIALKKAADLDVPRSLRRLRYIDFELHANEEAAAKRDLAQMNLQTPDYFPAWIYGMKLAYRERRFDDATAIATKILSRDPANYDALLESGLLKTNRGDTAGAINDLKRADRIYNHTPEVMYALAIAYIKKGDSANAESCLNQTLILAPNFDEASLRLADVEIGKGDLDAAVQRLNALLKVRPKNERAYLLLARAYRAEKNPAQALAVYRQAAQESPQDPQIPYLTGVLLNQQGRRPEARQALEKALAITPTYSPALDMIVGQDVATRQVGAAEERVATLIAHYPKFAEPYILRAKLHLLKREAGPAETDLLQAIQVDPQSQAAYLLLARVYVASDKPQDAIDKLTAVADKTNSTTALMQLGMLHSQLKQFDAARSAYERLLKVDPKSVLALNNLAYIYAENLGQLDKAETAATQATVLAPEDPSAADTLGWIKFRRGSYRDALTLIQAAAEGSPSSPEIQYHLGMTNYMLGLEEPARLALHQAVISTTDFPGKDDARQELAILNINPATATSAAKAELEHWARAHPQDPIAAQRLAAVEARNGSASSAAASFEASLKLNPHDTKTLVDLAALYAGPLKNPARARELVKSAHEQSPDDAALSAALGRLLYLTGDYAWSLTLLQQASRDNPGDPAMAYALARGYYSAGNVTQAESALQDLLGGGAAFPERAEAERLAGQIAAAQTSAQAKEDLPAARKILDADPAYVPALMVTAIVSEQEGNYRAAADGYEKILAADPLFAPASRQVALLYVLRLHDDQKAYDAAMKARGVMPDDPDVAKTLGIVAYHRGDYATAASSLSHSLSLRPDDAEAVFYSGMTHFKANELVNAKTDLEHALELDPTGPNAAETKRTLTAIAAAIKAQSQDSPAGDAAN